MPVGVCAFVCVLPLQTYLFLRLMPCVLVTFCCVCGAVPLQTCTCVLLLFVAVPVMCLLHVLLLATLGLGLPVKLLGHSMLLRLGLA